MIKSIFHDESCDFPTEPARFAGFMHNYSPAGFFYGLKDCFKVQGPEGPQVNHLRIDALFFQLTEDFKAALLETDPELKSLYLDSLRRTWNGDNGHAGVKVEANPFCTFMYHAFTGDGSGDAAAIRTLERFPLDMKFNRDTLEKYQKEFGFTFDPAPESAPAPPGTVVPIDLRPKSWSAWVADPYKPGTRTADYGMEYTGLDFTMAYWLGRYHGYISPVQ